MTKENKRPKAPKIGLRQAQRLCQLSHRRRLEFLAEGLPIILHSAQSFWESSERLRPSHGREAKVLDGLAKEEAAKVLILMDAVRCPPKLIASKLNRIVGWFYEHLARLIYADAVSWRPMHFAQLREYVDLQRRGHFIDGHAGEYILPNWTIYQRESTLYVDIEADQDQGLNWSIPRNPYTGLEALDSFMPPALRLVAAMEQIGLFKVEGLQAVSDTWGSLEYLDKEDHHDGEMLTERLLHRLHAEGLMLDTVEKEDVAALYRDWQLPMYNLDFSLIPVTIEELEAAQEREYWSMVDP